MDGTSSAYRTLTRAVRRARQGGQNHQATQHNRMGCADWHGGPDGDEQVSLGATDVPAPTRLSIQTTRVRPGSVDESSFNNSRETQNAQKDAEGRRNCKGSCCFLRPSASSARSASPCCWFSSGPCAAGCF